jgi:hypothetical protein
MKSQSLQHSLDVYCATFKRPTTPSPTFSELRKKHNIELKDLSHKSGLTIYTIRLLDEFNEATPEVFNLLVKTLSDLSGTNYSRATVGGVTFVVKPDLSKVLLRCI